MGAETSVALNTLGDDAICLAKSGTMLERGKIIHGTEGIVARAMVLLHETYLTGGGDGSRTTAEPRSEIAMVKLGVPQKKSGVLTTAFAEDMPTSITPKPVSTLCASTSRAIHVVDMEKLLASASGLTLSAGGMEAGSVGQHDTDTSQLASVAANATSTQEDSNSFTCLPDTAALLRKATRFSDAATELCISSNIESKDAGFDDWCLASFLEELVVVDSMPPDCDSDWVIPEISDGYIGQVPNYGNVDSVQNPGGMGMCLSMLRHLFPWYCRGSAQQQV